MVDVTALTSLLEKSINTPLLVADPAYIAIKADLASIVSFYASRYTNEELILLYSKKEVYLRLATAVAPSYDLEAQFTKLTKSVRFDHYFKLVNMVQAEITANSELYTEVQHADVVMESRDGGARNYYLDNLQTGTLTISNITSSTVDLDWTCFDTSSSNFSHYDVYLSTSVMYDPYEEVELKLNVAEKSYRLVDIFKNKLRVKDLSSATKYYVVLVYYAKSGRKTIVSSSFTTL